ATSRARSARICASTASRSAGARSSRSGWQPRAGRTSGCRSASSSTATLLGGSLPTATTRAIPARPARARVAPTSANAGSARCQWEAISSGLLPGNGHAGDLERGGGGLVPESEVAPDHLDVPVHVAQVAGDGDLLDRIGELASLDPVSHRAPGVVAGHVVD